MVKLNESFVKKKNQYGETSQNKPKQAKTSQNKPKQANRGEYFNNQIL